MNNAEIIEIMYIFSEGNPGAATLVKELIKSHEGCELLKECDRIRNSRCQVIHVV